MRVLTRVLAVSAVCAAVILGLPTAGAGAGSTRVAATVGTAAGGPDVLGATDVAALPFTDADSINGDSITERDAVWKMTLAEGQRIFADVNATSGSGSAALYLWSRETTTVKGDLTDDRIVAQCPYEHSPNAPAALRLTYTVPAGGAGTYYLNVRGSQGALSFSVAIKDAPTGFTVTAPAVVTYGVPFTVKGAIAPNDAGHAGTSVEVWALYKDIVAGMDLTRMSLVGRGTVAADGTWSMVALTPRSSLPWTSTLRIEWAGDANHGWVDETKVVKVRPLASLKASRRRVRRGSRVVLSGRIDPGAARVSAATRTRVQIQYRLGRRGWRTLRTFNLSSKGTYRYSYPLRYRGTYRFRVRYIPAAYAEQIGGARYYRYVVRYSRTVLSTAR